MTNDSARKRMCGRAAAIAFIAIALIGAGYAAHVWRHSQYVARRTALGIPSAQSIAEALHRQEAARGSIEVTGICSYSLLANPGQMRIQYIRSGPRSFVQRAYPDSTLSGSFDTSTGEVRELMASKSGVHGVVLNHAGALIRGIMVPDPIRRPLSADKQVDLVDVLETGEVGNPMQPVDGYRCWPMSVKHPEDYMRKCTVWVDPKIGYLPRRVVFVYTKQPGKYWAFGSYKALAPGVWFPMRISGGTLGGAEEYVIDITHVRIGRALPRSRILVRFPSGTQVEDQVANRRYTVP